MRQVLICAAIYNFIFGLQAVLFPSLQFELLGMTPPNYPFLWQCIGMIVGVYGVGYWLAASDPIGRWPIILVGFLGKILGPIGFAVDWLKGEIPGAFGYTIILNDLIWWLPFAAILWSAARWTAGSEGDANLESVLNTRKSSFGKTIMELSGGSGVLVVFLRHLGCTFCREALDDLRQKLPKFAGAGVELALVHMSPEAGFAEAAEKYGLGGAHAFSDPSREMYQAFELRRGGFIELFGPKVFLRGIGAMKHGLGTLQGDGFQMPGAFFIKDGKVISAFRHQLVSDRPEYGEICLLGQA